MVEVQSCCVVALCCIAADIHTMHKFERIDSVVCQHKIDRSRNLGI